MLNLIIKDFKAGWMFLIAAVILSTLITALAIWAMLDDFGSIIVGVFTLITTTLCIGFSFVFIAVDTAFNAGIIYASLPVKRAVIVYARYVSSFLLTTISFSFVILACYSAVSLFGQTDPFFDKLLSWPAIISMNLVLLLILSFILPFIFKFGSGKGFMAAMITQIFLIMAGELLLKTLNGIFTFDFTYYLKLINSVIAWLSALPAYQTYLMLSSVVISIIIISVLLSVWFYNRRDL